jgi:hypothetical protein
MLAPSQLIRDNNRRPYFPIVTQQCKQAVIEFHSNETVVYGLLLIYTVGSENEERLDMIRSATVDGEDIRSSGLINGRLMMYTPRCRCGVQVDR